MGTTELPAASRHLLRSPETGDNATLDPWSPKDLTVLCRHERILGQLEIKENKTNSSEQSCSSDPFLLSSVLLTFHNPISLGLWFMLSCYLLYITWNCTKSLPWPSHLGNHGSSQAHLHPLLVQFPSFCLYCIPPDSFQHAQMICA